MARVVGAALLLGIGLLLGCSGKTEDDEDDDKTVPAPTQCQKYASTWCSKAFNCYAQVGRIDEATAQANIPQCVQKVTDSFPCSAATSVTDDFDKCISQVKGMACSKWDVPQTQFGTITIPAACNNAISFE
jgi:hypothetical protein